jgi:hypothetical protein
MYMRTVQLRLNEHNQNQAVYTHPPLVPFRCDASRDLGTPEPNTRMEKERREVGDRKKTESGPYAAPQIDSSRISCKTPSTCASSCPAA